VRGVEADAQVFARSELVVVSRRLHAAERTDVARGRVWSDVKGRNGRGARPRGRAQGRSQGHGRVMTRTLSSSAEKGETEMCIWGQPLSRRPSPACDGPGDERIQHRDART
jgi:hypothetical protein